MTTSSKKRSLSPDMAAAPSSSASKRSRSNNSHLLTELTDVLAEIKSTPSSGEISAELLANLKLLMLQIEHLSADETNTEAIQMKHESDRCLESWFDELVAQCEADGELDLDTLEDQLAAGDEDDDDDYDIEAALSLALALQDGQDQDHEVDQEELEEEEANSPAVQLLA